MRPTFLRAVAILIPTLLPMVTCSAATYLAKPYFCLNTTSCGYTITPNGTVWLNFSPPPTLPGETDPPAGFSGGTGLFLLPGDHQLTHFAPLCQPLSTTCSAGQWSGQVAFVPSPPSQGATYEVTGKFQTIDLAPGPNEGKSVTGIVDMFIQCQFRRGCEPRQPSAGDAGKITLSVQ
jgi:hypothetical protein